MNDLADPLAQVAAAYDGSGTYTMMNVWDPLSGNLLRSGSSEKAQWALTDALGSITGLVSNPASTGKTDWHATYDEFGQPMSRRKFDPSFPQGSSYFGFTGEPYDFVTGLTYLRNRYYAPNLGRFTSPDPLGTILGDPTTLNGYGYVMNNPLRWVDPWGLGPLDNSPSTAYTDSASGEFLAGAIAGAVVTKGVAAVGAKMLGGIIAAHPVAAAVVGGAMLIGGAVASYQQRKEEQVQAGTWGKWSGLKTTLAAIGDVLGVSQVIEGITGKRLLTGEELSPGAAGWQLGSGVGIASSWAQAATNLARPKQTTSVTTVSDSKKIGWTGKLGEEALEPLGGTAHEAVRTPLGLRYVDRMVDGAAHESKVGYTALTKAVEKQVAKDAWMLTEGGAKSVTWHFYTSPVTGAGGPSKPLLDALVGAGIDVVLH